jgi:hypothetical protein
MITRISLDLERFSGAVLSFAIDGTDAATRTGWSVVISGEAVEVTGPA